MLLEIGINISSIDAIKTDLIFNHLLCCQKLNSLRMFMLQKSKKTHCKNRNQTKHVVVCLALFHNVAKEF